MKRLLLLGAACGALLSGCAHDDGGGDPVLKDLEIVGASQVSPKDLKKKILTEETSWIPFSGDKHFDENTWRTDLARIERYYQERGYYQAKVVSSEVKPTGKEEVSIRVEVDEGEPTAVTRIMLDGGQELPAEHQESLNEAVPFKTGDVFVEQGWEDVEDRLEASFREDGYARAAVTSNARVDLETHGAELDVHVVPGPRYKFGLVNLKDHLGDRVEDWRIVEQAKEAIEDEEWFSDTAIDEAQNRIFRMGVFGASKVTAGEAHPETGLIDLDVEVQEAPFHSLRGGFGIGIDQARNDLHAIGGYEDRNFLGGLRKLELEARAGWAFLPTAYAVARGGNRVTKNGPIAKVSADLFQPRLFDPNFSGTTRAELESALEPAYSYLGGRGKVGVSWQPYTWFTLTPSYNVEVYQLASGAADLRGGSPALLFGCPRNCVLSYLEQNLEVDRRDDKLEPKKGYLLALAFQEGGGFLGGSFDYLRVVPEARGYVSFLDDERLTLSAKVRAGSLIPLQGTELDSPIVARFFSGGNQMRGFSTRRLSPMLLVPRPEEGGEYESEPLPIGGNGLFESQFEVRYGLTKSLVGAVFTDLGLVTTEQLQRSSFRQLQLAVGGGVRYRTPVGPIRLDLAYRPDVGPPLQVYQAEGAALTYRQSQGCFGFGNGKEGGGGSPEGPCALHLSIGEAF